MERVFLIVQSSFPRDFAVKLFTSRLYKSEQPGPSEASG